MFEWDEEKRKDNLEKHGVDFVRAAMIFTKPVIEFTDERRDYGETRLIALGHVGDEYYRVVYTWRGPNRRLISAWKAGQDGERRYQAVHARRN